MACWGPLCRATGLAVSNLIALSSLCASSLLPLQISGHWSVQCHQSVVFPGCHVIGTTEGVAFLEALLLFSNMYLRFMSLLWYDSSLVWLPYNIQMYHSLYSHH